MPTIHTMPTGHARALVAVVHELREETRAIAAAGLLAASFDDLLAEPGPLLRWLDEVARACDVEGGGSIVLPVPRDGTLQQVAYGLAALLVWAATLCADGRLLTVLPNEALAAFAVLEDAAGLPRRTMRAIERITTADTDPLPALVA